MEATEQFRAAEDGWARGTVSGYFDDPADLNLRVE